MRIAIDATALEAPYRTGIKTYLLGILDKLAFVAPSHTYFLYFKNSLALHEKFTRTPFVSKVLYTPAYISWTNYSLWNTFVLPKNLFEDKIDVFFSPNYTLPFIFPPTKKVVTIHDISFEAHPEWFPEDWLKKTKKWVRNSAQRADVVVTNSKFCKSEISHRYTIDGKKIFVVHPGVNSQLETMPEGRLLEQLRISLRKYGVNKKFILSVGNFYPRRNTNKLLDAFTSVAFRLKDYQLVIIGKNQKGFDEGIDVRINRANDVFKQKRVILLDYVSDEELCTFYKCASLFVSLSTYEGFGSYAMLEAMSYGCPILAVKMSSMPELLGRSCVYTPVYDTDEVSKVLVKTLQSKQLLNTLSVKAKRRIRKFSTENMASEFVAACEYAYRK